MPGVVLSSLKVGADFDSSAYVRGAVGKAEADQRMIASDQARIAAMARAEMAMQRQMAAIGSYTAAVNDNSRAMAEMIQNSGDSSRSFLMTGIEAANVAEKLKLATVAAYALSPSFRALVNPAITASFRAMGPAAVSAAGAAFTAFSPLLTTIGRLALPIAVATESFKAMEAITALGADKLKEFNELAANAGAAGVSTDFFQRQAAGAKDLGIEVTAATEALKKFNTADQAQLGGSSLQQRVDQLIKAGNFQGNPGVASLQLATSTAERYQAVVQLVTVAADQGQRLAALDLASKFLPPEILDRLRASSTTLREMQQAAADAKPADIIDAAQIGYALELKRRLDDANETIANGMKPVQRDLTQLGLNYQESWVDIREAMASGVTHANDLYSALKGIPSLFAQAGSASFWTKLTEYTGKLGLNSTPESMGLILPGQPGYSDDAGRAALTARLRNPNAVQQAMRQATDIQSAVRRDTSINPVAAQPDPNDAVDRAINTLRKHVEEQNADTAAMGLGVAALARFRAEAAETAAVQANGGKETAAQAEQFKLLQQRAADAALALEKAKIAQQISFGRQTALLSPEDVQIAQQLKGVYPDVATALGSVEAQAMRVNQALSSVSGTISNDLVTGIADATDRTKTWGQSFTDTSKLIIRAIEEMIIKLYIIGPLMRGLQSGFGQFIPGLGTPGQTGDPNLIGPVRSANGNVFARGNVIPFARGGIVTRPVYFPMANGAGLMGEAGPEAVMPLRRGADGRLGVTMSGAGASAGYGPQAPQVNVILNEHPGGDGSVKQKPNANGGVDIEVSVAQIAAKSTVQPGGAVNRALSAGYGLRPAIRHR